MDAERKVSMSKSDSIKTYSLSLDSQFLGTSLNKANQQERGAERFILSRQYDEAIKCHKKAAEYLLKALEKTKNMETRKVLQLKYDHHNRQPALLEATQQREKQRKQLLIEMNEKVDKKDTNESSGETDNTDNGHDNADLEAEERYDSVENADSLLHILKENTKEENGNITYRTPNLFNYFKANPLASWTSQGQSSEVLTKKTCSKRPSFEKDKIIHDLHLTIMTLVKNMYSCEEENKCLKERVDALQNELENSRCRENLQDGARPLQGPLTTLFSTDNDHVARLEDDNFQLNSLQPLPEIDMPENNVLVKLEIKEYID